MEASVSPLKTRARLSEVRYEIRGELARRARELEAGGRRLIKLNIGNPGAFGFRAPAHLQQAIAAQLAESDPYTHQQGLPAAPRLIAECRGSSATIFPASTSTQSPTPARSSGATSPLR